MHRVPMVSQSQIPAHPVNGDVLVDKLRSIVGRRHVLTRERATRRFRHGYRSGHGCALAVVRPGSLVEQWRVLRACVEAGVIVIAQAANTGLTGGSTPDGNYDRPVVIISTLRLDGIHLILEGRQVVCLPGATLHSLKAELRPLGREPHSVIGSSCIGASVLGGVCNNSGGALVRRGPAYTELSLYAWVDDQGCLSLINHLGIDLGDEPEAMLEHLEHGKFSPDQVDPAEDRRASDHDYGRHVRDISASTPTRFNADAFRLFEASGSAGKVMLFAVRLDTFIRDAATQVFYVGTNDPGELTALRRAIPENFTDLPVAGEYIHRDCFDIAARYGKDIYLAIRTVGTDRLPTLFATKAVVDSLPFLPAHFSDRCLQWVADRLPHHLPKRMVEFRDRYEHHLMLRMVDTGVEQARAWLSEHFPSSTGAFFECSEGEGTAAFLLRFVAAGAAIRYRAIHPGEVEDIVSLDIALPRDCESWVEQLPAALESQIVHRLYYGHFLCHVFHQDYIVAKGGGLRGARTRHFAAAR